MIVVCSFTGRDFPDGKVGTSSRENERHPVEIHQATSRSSVFTASTKGWVKQGGVEKNTPQLFSMYFNPDFDSKLLNTRLFTQKRYSCWNLIGRTVFELFEFLKTLITTERSGEAVASSIECPLCLAELTPKTSVSFRDAVTARAYAVSSNIYAWRSRNLVYAYLARNVWSRCTLTVKIRSILDNPALYAKYEDFMVRRVLAVDPDTRWCPAPDCCFAVIASECASCPKLKCERPGCDSYFCYHCKAEWHPNQTCDAARAQRSPNIRSSSITYSQDSQHRDDIKPCPRCQVLIVKMDDGSCNHMMCTVCGAEFCWLCMKEINDLHFLSNFLLTISLGMHFLGKKPWSRKKKILWQLGTLVGAPVGIALVAGITVPAMIIGIPVWVGRKLYARYKSANKHKRNAAIVGGVVASVSLHF
ncbi:hypothetical protein NQ317_018785 [Molorchus minor]|uniref:RBR-type E3 ubiquitin transferase n=1 Tax=Molorchus minor TaxID=1323400 RepID=A0ABQ9J6A9_9CUCU|nr:hypothetical protein NQ317_018785 [Molorchus minor]